MAYTDVQMTGIQVASFLATGKGNQLLKPDTQPWTAEEGTVTLNELNDRLTEVKDALAAAEAAAAERDAAAAARHDALVALLGELHPAPEEPPAEEPVEPPVAG